MDQNAMLRSRTNEILRERIALGLTAGGARKRRAGSKRKAPVRRRAPVKRLAACRTPRGKTVRRHKGISRCPVGSRKGGDDNMLDELFVDGEGYALNHGNGVMAAGHHCMCPECGGEGCDMCAGEGVLVGGARLAPCRRSPRGKTVRRRPYTTRCPVGSRKYGGEVMAKVSRKSCKVSHGRSKSPWICYLQALSSETGRAYGDLMKDCAVSNSYRQQMGRHRRKACTPSGYI